MNQKILFLTPYPNGTAGSQRFRFEQYFEILKSKGFVIDNQSFLDDATWNILYLPGNGLKKGLGVIRGFLRRTLMIFRAYKYNYIFIHREASPLGPPIFEWILCEVLNKNVIYDYDDAIWKENTTNTNSLASFLKWSKKVDSISKWVTTVSVGNEFLANYAKEFNNQVVVNPTTIDTVNLHTPRNNNEEKIVVGWTGTHSTLQYLEPIAPLLNEIALSRKVEILIIANQKPKSAIKHFTFKPWNIDSEIDDLNKIDIGLMPLNNDEWAKGKCGFKALQFMALEKPVLVSPVGINEQIVEDGISGHHCITPEDWKQHLIELIDNTDLRIKMGAIGRQKVENEFSVQSNTDNFLSLFQ